MSLLKQQTEEWLAMTTILAVTGTLIGVMRDGSSWETIKVMFWFWTTISVIWWSLYFISVRKR